MSRVRSTGNTWGTGNAGGTKSTDHKNKIATSIREMYAEKKKNGVSHMSMGGRPRAIDYSIIITTVQQKGFNDAAIEFRLSVSAMRGRYYTAIKAQKDK